MIKKCVYLISMITILITATGMFSMLNAKNLALPSLEAQLEQRQLHEIADFWKQGQFKYFTGVDESRINYVSFNSAQNLRCLVISPGRSEGYLKYKELAFDLYQQGFNIYVLDHRGQGISQRLLDNPHKGYVKDFEYYVDDLHSFIEKVVNPACNNDSGNMHQKTQSKPYLLAHSMGGMIAIRYMQRYPQSIQATVLSSPMIAINSGPAPAWLIKGIIGSTQQINQWFSDEPWYFLGQNNYKPKNFTDNVLTHSSIRYNHFVNLYKSTNDIQLGGVTVQWLHSAIITNNKIFEELVNIKTPTLVIQSGEDTVVDNSAQDEFCQQLNKFHPHSCPEGKPVIIAGAFHELFFELDKFRNQALEQSLKWFNSH